MNSLAALQRLLTLLSPAFPVGAFAWSAGLETAIVEGAIADATTLQSWLVGLMVGGGIKSDAIFVAHAYRSASDAEALADLSDLCLALIPAAERRSETLTTGDAFVRAASAWPTPAPPQLPSPCPYPLAVGAIAAAQQVRLEETLVAFLTAAVQAQVSVAVRLVPLGQTQGLGVIAALEPRVRGLATDATAAPLDAIGGIAYGSDIAQMRHEELGTRIFRS